MCKAPQMFLECWRGQAEVGRGSPTSTHLQTSGLRKDEQLDRLSSQPGDMSPFDLSLQENILT